MNINRNNYEEFFLLYADNELTAEERTMVEHFVTLHPDLGEELGMLSQTKLPAEEKVTYANKAALYRHTETSLVNENNYNEYFLLYVDNELNTEEKSAVEAFATVNNKQVELLLLQKIKLQPEENIVFKNKDILYRTEKQPARIIPMRWIRVAAAAAVLLTGIAVWTNINEDETISENDPQTVIAGTGSVKESNNKQIQPAHQDTEHANKVSTAEEKGVEQVIITTPINKGTGQPGIEKDSERRATTTVEPEVSDLQKTIVPEEKKSTNIIAAPAKEHTTETISNISKVPDVSTQQIALNSAVKPDRNIKPLILDETAFNGQDKTADEQQVVKNNDQVVFLDTDNTDKKPKGKLRGLFRKASRIIDHATNAGEVNDQSIVRVASFEIAKK